MRVAMAAGLGLTAAVLAAAGAARGVRAQGDDERPVGRAVTEAQAEADEARAAAHGAAREAAHAAREQADEARQHARELGRQAREMAREARRAADEARRVVVLGAGGGRLGVRLDEVRAEDVARLGLDEERGAIVRDVQEDSAAAEAGLQEGDVIVGYQGETVRSAAHLARLVRETPAGRSVALEVSRDGERRRLTAKLREPRGLRVVTGDMPHFDFDFDFDELTLPEPPEPPVAPRAPRAPLPPKAPLLDRNWGGFFFGPRHTGRLGIGYQEIDGQLARYFEVEDRGVLVTHVEAGSPAEQAGLKAGDVVVKVAGAAVKDGGDLREALRGADDGASVTLSVLREGRPLELTAKLRERRRPASGSPV